MIYNKWKQIRWSYPMVSESIDLFYNVRTLRQVYVDVYEKKRWNGTMKYKKKIVAMGKVLSVTQLNF